MEIELVIFYDADIFTTIFLLSCVKRFARWYDGSLFTFYYWNWLKKASYAYGIGTIFLITIQMQTYSG